MRREMKGEKQRERIKDAQDRDEEIYGNGNRLQEIKRQILKRAMKDRQQRTSTIIINLFG